jgi:hypothetical protein
MLYDVDPARIGSHRAAEAAQRGNVMADWVPYVNAATGANDAVIPGFTAGSPNTFVGTVSNPLPSTIDGVTLAINSRVLVKNQTTASQNGIYVWTSGSGSTAVWTQTTDYTVTSDAQVAVRVGPGSTTSLSPYTHWVLKDTTSNLWVRQFVRASVRTLVPSVREGLVLVASLERR